MNREFLKELGLEKEVIDQIMAENGKDIQAEKAKFSDYDTLKGENESYKKQVDDLNQSIEVQKTSLNDYQSKIATLEATNKDYERNSLKTKIALENGLPYEFASRLQGDDETAIKKDAEALAGYVSTSASAPGKSYEPTVDAQDSAYKNVLSSLGLDE